MNDPKPGTPKSDTSNPQSSKTENGKPAILKATDPRSRESNAPALAGLGIAVVLLVMGLWLAHELRAASKLQDCVMSGRTNCNEIRP